MHWARHQVGLDRVSRSLHRLADATADSELAPSRGLVELAG